MSLSIKSIHSFKFSQCIIFVKSSEGFRSNVCKRKINCTYLEKNVMNIFLNMLKKHHHSLSNVHKILRWITWIFKLSDFLISDHNEKFEYPWRFFFGSVLKSYKLSTNKWKLSETSFLKVCADLTEPPFSTKKLTITHIKYLNNQN